MQYPRKEATTLAATDPPRRRLVDLDEGIEDRRQLLWRHADAGDGRVPRAMTVALTLVEHIGGLSSITAPAR